MHIHSARGISDNGALVGDDGQCTTVAGADAGQGHNGALVGDDGYFYPHRLCWLGRLQLSFLYKLLTLMRRPDTIFSELKLASLKYYTP
jgi:hypothetical protein